MKSLVNESLRAIKCYQNSCPSPLRTKAGFNASEITLGWVLYILSLPRSPLSFAPWEAQKWSRSFVLGGFQLECYFVRKRSAEVAEKERKNRKNVLKSLRDKRKKIVYLFCSGIWIFLLSKYLKDGLCFKSF